VVVVVVDVVVVVVVVVVTVVAAFTYKSASLCPSLNLADLAEHLTYSQTRCPNRTQYHQPLF